jgi:hypothetical protein
LFFSLYGMFRYETITYYDTLFGFLYKVPYYDTTSRSLSPLPLLLGI